MTQNEILERIANSLERIANQFDPMRREDADPYDGSGHCIHCGAPDLAQNTVGPAAEMPQDDEPYFADIPLPTDEQAAAIELREILKAEPAVQIVEM